MMPLENSGNVSYMSSTIQCLSATIPFARFFKNGSYRRAVNWINPLGAKGKLADSTAHLVTALWNRQDPSKPFETLVVRLVSPSIRKNR